MSRQLDVTFIIPCASDPRAGRSIACIRDYAAARGLRIEIIVAGTPPLDEILGARFVSVTPPLKGACIKAGVASADGDVVITVDADLPLPPEQLDRFTAALATNEVAVGNRIMRGSLNESHLSPIRWLGTRCFRSIVSAVFGLQGWDTQCGIKVYRHAAAKVLFANLSTKGFAYDVEIALKARDHQFRVQQVPVTWRNGQESTLSFPWACISMLGGISLLWLNRFDLGT